MPAPLLFEITTLDALIDVLDDHLVETLDQEPPSAEDDFADTLIKSLDAACKDKEIEMGPETFATMLAGLYVGIRLGTVIARVVPN